VNDALRSAIVTGRKSYILSAMSAPLLSADAERILLIRPTALGDVARTVPALASLRRALPGARIDWLVHDAFADAVRYHPALSNVVLFPRDRFGAAWRSPAVLREFLAWIDTLRKARYTRVIDLQGLFRSGAITRLTGAKKRVGFSNAREVGWLGYNEKHPVDPAMHTVDRMLALIGAHGIPIQHDMRLYVGPDDTAWLDHYTREQNITDAQGGYFVIAPTARWRCKCWPMDRYETIARRLLETKTVGVKAVLLASPTEAPLVAPLAEKLGRENLLVSPRTSVGQMLAIISKAKFVLCNDSAPLHVAVGFDRPLVTVFGPTDPALVGPYRRPETVVQPPNIAAMGPRAYRQEKDDQSLISGVTIDAVWASVETELAHTRAV
jgi:heptosyltransferase-1